MNKAQYFYESVSPILVISLLIGITPIFMKHVGNERTVYTSRKLYSVNIAYIIGYTFLMLKTLDEAKNNVIAHGYYQNNKISNIGIAFVLMGDLLLFYVIYICGFLKTESIKNVLIRMYNVDKILENFGQDLKYKKTIVYQLLTLIPSYFLICFNVGMQYQNIQKEHFRSLSKATWSVFIIPLFAISTFANQFPYAVIFVYQRMKMLNQQMRKLQIHQTHVKGVCVPYADGSKINAAKISVILEKIKIFMKMHDELCGIARAVNDNYTLQEVTALTVQYGIALFSLFYSYWMFSSKPFSASCWLLWSLLKICEVLHITISCHMASREARRTGAEVHKLLIAPCDIEIRNKLMSFSNQLMHSKVSFSIWGIITLDATLLFTGVGAAATYMVIMLQFQQASIPLTCIATSSNSTHHPTK